MNIIKLFVVSVCTLIFLVACGGDSEITVVTPNDSGGDGAETKTIVVQGKILIAETQNEAAIANITVINQSDGSVIATGKSTSEGYTFSVPDSLLGKTIRIQVVQTLDGLPPVTGTLVVSLPETGETVTLNNILLPDVSVTNLHNDGSGTFTALDNSGFKIENVPTNVAAVWGQPFNPDFTPEAFPGEFFDSDDDALNSSAFVWIVATDEDGNEIKDFSAQPLTVTIPVDRDQWIDLLDINPGNGQIDIPMYSFNEGTGEWDRENGAAGVLVDEGGNLFTEEQGDSIRNQTFSNAVFVRFSAAHLSWWNVDYAWHTDLTPPGLGTNDTFGDFGNAPTDLGYPIIQHNRGRGEGNASVWLGQWVSFETSQQVTDTNNDGMLECGSGKPLAFRINNLTQGETKKTLYLNVLIDRNQDGDWEDEGEWVTQNLATDVKFRAGIRVETEITEWLAGQWLRATVTASPIDNFIGGGVYDDGETEDYEGCYKTVRVNNRRNYFTPRSFRVYSETPVDAINCDRQSYTKCVETLEAGKTLTLVAEDTDLQTNVKVNWQLDSGLSCSEGVAPSEKCTFNVLSERNVISTSVLVDTYRLDTGFSHWNYSVGSITSDQVAINCGDSAKDCRYTAYEPVSSITLQAKPNEGYYFGGWDSSGSILCANDADEQCVLTPATGNTSRVRAKILLGTLVATRIEEGKGTIKAEGIECDNVSATTGRDCHQRYKPGTSVVLAATPDKGHSFIGWGGACESAGAANTCTVTVESTTLNVSANFSANLQKVITDASNGGTVGRTTAQACPDTVDGVICHRYGEQVTLTAQAELGYAFTGWDGCDDNVSTVSGTCIFTVSGDRTVKANFTQKTKQVSVIASNGVVTSSPAGIDCGTACQASFPEITNGETTQVELTAEPDANYVFDSWQGCPSRQSNVCTVGMNRDHTVTANFVLGDHQLTVTQPEGGIITSPAGGIDCGTTCSQAFTHGTEVTLMATAADSHTFTGWNGCPSPNGNQCKITMDKAYTVGATFQIKQYTVETAVDGEGSITSTPTGINCGTTCSATFDHGTSVTLTPSAGTGKQFGGWTNCPVTPQGDDCTFTITQSYTAANSNVISASFTDQLIEITTQAGSNGSVSRNPAAVNCPGTTNASCHPFGQSVTLTAQPDDNYEVAAWSGCDGGVSTDKSQCTLTVGSAQTVGVTFSPIQRELTVAKQGSGSIESDPIGINCGTTCTATFNAGLTVGLTAEPDDGHEFIRWENCPGEVNNNTCQVPMTQAYTSTDGIRAVFNAITPVLTVNKSGSGMVSSSPAGINCGTDCSEVLNYNTDITLTATPDAGHRVQYWSGACSNETGNTCTLSMTEDQTIGVVFEAIPSQYSLDIMNLYPELNSSVTVSPTESGKGATCSARAVDSVNCSQKFTPDTVVTLTVNLAEGERFDGWQLTGNAACEPLDTNVVIPLTCDVTMDQNRSVSVYISPDFNNPLSSTDMLINARFNSQ